MTECWNTKVMYSLGVREMQSYVSSSEKDVVVSRTLHTIVTY